MMLRTWWVCDADSADDAFDSFVKIEHVDAESAAEEWAEQDDYSSADYTIIGGSPATVVVQDHTRAEVGRFVVSGEAVPQYRARRLTDGEVTP